MKNKIKIFYCLLTINNFFKFGGWIKNVNGPHMAVVGSFPYVVPVPNTWEDPSKVSVLAAGYKPRANQSTRVSLLGLNGSMGCVYSLLRSLVVKNTYCSFKRPQSSLWRCYPRSPFSSENCSTVLCNTLINQQAGHERSRVNHYLSNDPTKKKQQPIR